MELENRIAIVTGGARGIGLAIARRFAAAGARVAIADIRDEEGRAAAAAHGLDYLHCDVSRSAEVASAVAGVIARFGAIDILVNNAAINLTCDLLDVTEDDYDRVLDVNLKGAFLMLQAVARHMVAQAEKGRNPGTIVNMSSVNDTLAIPTIATYCMSKGGIAQLTAAASIRLAAHGIRVNAIGPGSIRTDMLTSVVRDPEAMARVLSRTPLGRPGEPDEIAAIALFLASDAASYVTGQTIYADGGRMPLNYTVPPRGGKGPA